MAMTIVVAGPATVRLNLSVDRSSTKAMKPRMTIAEVDGR
jgi:hypothetical protein